jgi:hypothetical protein
MYRPGTQVHQVESATLKDPRYQYDSDDSDSSSESLFSPVPKTTAGASGKSIDNQSSVESYDDSTLPYHEESELVHVETTLSGTFPLASSGSIAATSVSQLSHDSIPKHDEVWRHEGSSIRSASTNKYDTYVAKGDSYLY